MVTDFIFVFGKNLKKKFDAFVFVWLGWFGAASFEQLVASQILLVGKHTEKLVDCDPQRPAAGVRFVSFLFFLLFLLFVLFVSAFRRGCARIHGRRTASGSVEIYRSRLERTPGGRLVCVLESSSSSLPRRLKEARDTRLFFCPSRK